MVVIVPQLRSNDVQLLLLTVYHSNHLSHIEVRLLVLSEEQVTATFVALAVCLCFVTEININSAMLLVNGALGCSVLVVLYLEHW